MKAGKRRGKGGRATQAGRTRGGPAARRAVGAPAAEPVLYRVDGRVAWITLNRPAKGNALAPGMREELLALIKEAGGDPGVGCLVLTGAGGHFCAGGDLRHLSDLRAKREPFDAVGRLMDLGERVVTALATLPKPSLASLPGPAAGAGCNLALACDFRIAAAGASLGETFSRVGLHPDWGGTYFLPRMVGTGVALELIATGRMVDAAEALRLGLVTRVVPASRLLSETRKLAERLCDVPPRPFLAAREALRRSLTSSLPGLLRFERHAQRLCWESEDSGEGIRAFLEKRLPRFTGR